MNKSVVVVMVDNNIDKLLGKSELLRFVLAMLIDAC
jgi:hypothetical protein